VLNMSVSPLAWPGVSALSIVGILAALVPAIAAPEPPAARVARRNVEPIALYAENCSKVTRLTVTTDLVD